MKNSLSSLELWYLVKELKQLENSKVDKIYNPADDKNTLTITVHVSSIGKRFLKTILPGAIYIDENKDTLENPTGLCMMLRKYLEGGILKSISQHNFERVLELEFEAKIDGERKKYFVMIELFSKGNIIFCDDSYKILNIMEEQHWKDRELKRGLVYIFPQSQYNVLELDAQQFTNIIRNSGKDSLVKSLAIGLSLGGIYAEELCHISNVDKSTRLTDIDGKSFVALYKNFKGLFTREIKPNLAADEVLPFELSLYSNDRKYYESFNQAIKENIGRHDKLPNEDALKKLNAIVEEQQKNLSESQANYELNQEIAELIYKNYQEIGEILSTLKDARQKYGWDEIKERIKKDKKMSSVIKKINEKSNEIVLELK